MSETMPQPAPRRRRWLLFAPVGLAAAAGAGFFVMLRGLQTGEYNPRGVPSTLIGRTPPEFTLPPVSTVDVPGLTSADLRPPLPAPVIVNFWASWCVPCVVEHPQLMRLSREGIAVLGINYKDRPADAAAFLQRHGNPYRKLASDEPGRTAIDWGVYGVPETYLIDRQGRVQWRFAGPVTPDVLERDLRLLLQRFA